jgi:dTDP-4-dehydrorhamnose reductase
LNNNRGRILITGGSGLLALNWAVTKRDHYSMVLGLHDRQINLSDVRSIPINLNSASSVSEILQRIQPEVVIHTAGLTNVESCEQSPELAREINVTLAGNVAQATKQNGIKLVHISTDHLFDGSKQNVSEDEPLAPLNAYGKTKGDAENEVLSANEDALIVRTNFYGWGPSYRSSFSDMIINNLRAERQITLFDDVFYTSILAENLITTAHELIDRNASGIYHVVGDERISKYEFGLKIAEEFGLDPTLIIPRSIGSNPNLVKRPLDMSLSNLKVCNFLGKRIGSADEQITRLKQQEVSNASQEIMKL